PLFGCSNDRTSCDHARLSCYSFFRLTSRTCGSARLNKSIDSTLVRYMVPTHRNNEGVALSSVSLEAQLRLPVIGSPMFIVSGPDLVIAQCKAGILGTMPSLSVR